MIYDLVCMIGVLLIMVGVTSVALYRSPVFKVTLPKKATDDGIFKIKLFKEVSSPEYAEFKTFDKKVDNVKIGLHINVLGLKTKVQFCYSQLQEIPEFHA